MLSDPTAGVGYAFGEILPSADMTTVAVQQPNALDATNGGTWTLGANATVNGASEMRLNHLRLIAAGSSTFDHAPTLAGTLNLGLTSRNIIRAQPMSVIDFGSNWAQTTTGIITNTPAAGSVGVELTRLANGQTLDNVSVRYKGAAGHAAFPGGAPAVMPLVTVYKLNQDGTSTSLGSQSDTSATAGAFEAYHTISAAGLAHVIDLTTYRYEVVIASESGANYIAAATCARINTSCTVTAYAEQ